MFDFLILIWKLALENLFRQYMLKICERNLLHCLEVGKKPMVIYYNRSYVFNCRCIMSNYASIATNKSDQELHPRSNC